MIYKSKFINTFGCGAGFPWLLAHTTPTCILGHPQLHGPAAGMDIYHCDTGIRVHGYRTAVYTYMYTLTYTRISTRTTALWRQLAVTTMALADPCSTTGWIYITGVLDATDLFFNWQLAYTAGSSGYRRYMALAYDGSDWLLRVLRASGRSYETRRRRHQTSYGSVCRASHMTLH